MSKMHKIHKIPRTSLACLVCPSAPFLVPQLLRTPVASTAIVLQHAPSCLPIRAFANTSKGEASHRTRHSASAGKPERWSPPEQLLSLRMRFDKACEARQVPELMRLYPMALESGILNSKHKVLSLMRAIHPFVQTIHSRSNWNYMEPEDREFVFPFLERIFLDFQSRTLPPHPAAFVHFLGIYRDSKRFDDGYKLWQWLSQQDDNYVGPTVYGAAIELMAVGKLASLPELERLFIQAMRRFPKGFIEYHLSPDAILPDRTQLTTTFGVPTIFVRGIFLARLLARDWVKAYVALDTVLRLYPTNLPSKFFEFIILHRPIEEAYTAFLLACRAGVMMKPGYLTTIIIGIKNAMLISKSLEHRIMLLRAVANALYAHVQTGAQLTPIHVTAFIGVFEVLLPQADGQPFEDESSELRALIATAASQMVSGLFQAGMPPQPSMLRALMSLAGRLRAPALLDVSLRGFKIIDSGEDPADLRVAIQAAGLVENRELIEQSWERIVSIAETGSNDGRQYDNWIALARACNQADHLDWLRQQMLRLPHTLTSGIEASIAREIDRIEIPARGTDFMYLTPAELTTSLEPFKAQMQNVQAVLMSGHPLDFNKTPFYMHLNPDHPSISNPKVLRAVYDKISTDPHQPAPDPPLPPASSPMGIPLDELRFQNWVNILEMMASAEAHDIAFQKVVDEAISSGQPLRHQYPLQDVSRLEDQPLLQTPEEVHKRVQGLRTATASVMSLKPVQHANPEERDDSTPMEKGVTIH